MPRPIATDMTSSFSRTSGKFRAQVSRSSWTIFAPRIGCSRVAADAPSPFRTVSSSLSGSAREIGVKIVRDHAVHV